MPELTAQTLRLKLSQADDRITELEVALHPSSSFEQLEFQTQTMLLEDIGSLLSLINSTEDLIWFVDRNKRVLLANEATFATFKTCTRLIEQIAEPKISTAQKQVSVTGCTMHSADDSSIDSVLKRADDARYRAKNAGRNQITCL